MPFRLKDRATSRALARLVMLIFSAALSLNMTADSVAQTRARKERWITNRIPAHLPLKVEVRNLDRDTWVDDVEVEVWNTSNKPIYFLDFFLTMPEIKGDNGYETGFALRYGRIQFVDFREPVQPDDVPIKPGESHIFKINPENMEGWKEAKKAKGFPDPLKFDLIFVQLNHGDGTGYSMTNGTPIDGKRIQQEPHR